SNLKRSRTELLASTNNPTWSGRLVSLWKLLMDAGRLSSTTWKSSRLRSFIWRPCLSVTVKTMCTSLTFLRMVVPSGSTSGAGVEDLEVSATGAGASDGVGGLFGVG